MQYKVRYEGLSQRVTKPFHPRNHPGSIYQARARVIFLFRILTSQDYQPMHIVKPDTDKKLQAFDLFILDRDILPSSTLVLTTDD